MMDFENETYEDFAEEQQEEAESREEDAAEDLDEEGWEEEEQDDWEETEETEEEAQSVWEKPFAVQEENLNNMLPEEIRLVQQAQEIVRKQQQQEADHFMEKEFLALQKEFPDCGLTEVGELLQTEAGKKALQLWKSVDIPLADAYAATHRAELQARQSAALRQGILNEMNGKRHLTQTRGGSEKTEMPADVRAEFRKYFPNASQKEIEKMYRKNRQQN